MTPVRCEKGDHGFKSKSVGDVVGAEVELGEDDEEVAEEESAADVARFRRDIIKGEATEEGRRLGEANCPAKEEDAVVREAEAEIARIDLESWREETANDILYERLDYQDHERAQRRFFKEIDRKQGLHMNSINFLCLTRMVFGSTITTTDAFDQAKPRKEERPGGPFFLPEEARGIWRRTSHDIVISMLRRNFIT